MKTLINDVPKQAEGIGRILVKKFEDKSGFSDAGKKDSDDIKKDPNVNKDDLDKTKKDEEEKKKEE